jgi:AcrR family transcriptional regulator
MMPDISFDIGGRVVPENSSDRRVRRTRNLLRNALFELILEKGYDRITVQDIIDRADIGRSTFYAHFTDKDDLLLSGLEEFGAAFEDNLNRHFANRADPSPALPVFRHAYENRDLYRAMAGKRGADVLHEGLRRHIAEAMGRHLGGAIPADDSTLPSEVTVEFVVSALLGLLTWWLDNGMPYSPEKMADMYMTLAMRGIPAAYGI